MLGAAILPDRETADSSSSRGEPLRLNWREKVFEFGLHFSLVLSAAMVSAIVLFGVLIAADRLAPSLVEESSVSYLLFIVVLIAIAHGYGYFCFPYMIRLLYRGYELKDEGLKQSMVSMIDLTGMDLAPERLYAIRNKRANAVVAGIIRRARYVFFADKLLERMTKEEIMAVFAHELAHIRHRHVPQMFFATILWIGGIQTLFYLLGIGAYLESWSIQSRILLSGAMTTVNIWLLTFLVLFPLSRRNEYEADATAAKWVGAKQYIEALYRLYELNGNLKPVRKIAAVLQTHPTLQNRIDRVAKLESR